MQRRPPPTRKSIDRKPESQGSPENQKPRKPESQERRKVVPQVFPATKAAASLCPSLCATFARSKPLQKRQPARKQISFCLPPARSGCSYVHLSVQTFAPTCQSFIESAPPPIHHLCYTNRCTSKQAKIPSTSISIRISIRSDHRMKPPEGCCRNWKLGTAKLNWKLPLESWELENWKLETGELRNWGTESWKTANWILVTGKPPKLEPSN